MHDVDRRAVEHAAELHRFVALRAREEECHAVSEARMTVEIDLPLSPIEHQDERNLPPALTDGRPSA